MSCFSDIRIYSNCSKCFSVKLCRIGKFIYSYVSEAIKSTSRLVCLLTVTTGVFIKAFCGNSSLGGADDAFANMTPEEAVAHFTEQGMGKNDAVKAAAKALGMTRNQLYGLLIK